ncbi:MAG: acyltransferase [Microgenomates group bacterium]
MIEEQKLHNSSINLMRIVATIAVVIIHTTTRILEVAHFDFASAPIAIFFNQLARFAVPLFFMISGYVLEVSYANYEDKWKFQKKRIEKILWPYIIWSAIYYYWVYTNHAMGYWQSLMGGNASYQLYFMPTLIIFYVIFPILSSTLKWWSNKYILGAIGVGELFLLTKDYYTHSLNMAYPLAVMILNIFVFMLGMTVSHHLHRLESILEKYNFYWFLATIAVGIYVVYEGISRYLSSGNYLAFYSQWRPSVLIYTILLAGSMYYLLSKINIEANVVRKISALSMGVFFVHVLVLEMMWKLWPNEWLLGLMTIVLSYGVVYGISKIPRLGSILS